MSATTAMTSAPPAGAASLPGGLMVCQGGYTLRLADRTAPAEAHSRLRFQILVPDGAPVTGYRTEHDNDLHLIAVRRDLSHLQHVHPVLEPEGTWSVPLDLSAAGEYRVFADFTPTGHHRGLVLGADLAVPGTYEPVALPEPATTAEVVDGYEVTLAGDLVPGQASELTLTVGRCPSAIPGLRARRSRPDRRVDADSMTWPMTGHAPELPPTPTNDHHPSWRTR